MTKVCRLLYHTLLRSRLSVKSVKPLLNQTAGAQSPLLLSTVNDSMADSVISRLTGETLP